MKKTTVRSIAIGSVALTAATAGAWFMLTSEPRKKEVLSPVPPLSSGTIQHQQASTPPEFDASAFSTTQLSSPSEETREVASVPIDSPSENSRENATKKKQEQDSETESAEDTAITAGEQATELSPLTHTEPTPPTSPAAPALPGLHTSENIDKEETPNNAATDPSFSPGKEEQQQNIADPTHLKDGQNISGPSCKEVSPTLSNFFNTLEKKDYSKEAIKDDRPLQEYFNALATQLLNNPPVVTHETDDLYTVLTNTAHFFRILGKDNMHLAQKVLKETTDFEGIAAEMYRLSTEGKECVSGNKRLEIPFTAAYEYAGFFLNTLGGRSYLFRRDPGTRLLVNYYAVLILDQANKKHLNTYGLDISEQLPWLIQEMEANNRLTRREEYLDKLYELAE
ncbi:hypothetical protein VU00_11501, partial [Candidatus Electrothrix marina]